MAQEEAPPLKRAVRHLRQPAPPPGGEERKVLETALRQVVPCHLVESWEGSGAPEMGQRLTTLNHSAL